MSSLSERASVSIIIADYAALDAAKKANLIGAGITFLGYNNQLGATAPFYVYVEITAPGGLAPLDAALEIWLEDDGGEVVDIPGAAGPQALRIGDSISLEKPRISGLSVPDSAPAQHTAILAFQNGLPLAAGRGYAWVVRLDGDSEHLHRRMTAVPGTPRGPVLG